MEVSQYEIVLVNLDPTIGSEIKKTRPCVILSPDEMNRHLKTVIIAPMTTTIRNYPSRTPVRHNKKDGMIALDQIRTVDKKRIVKKFNTLSDDEVVLVKSVLQEMLVN